MKLKVLIVAVLGISILTLFYSLNRQNHVPKTSLTDAPLDVGLEEIVLDRDNSKPTNSLNQNRDRGLDLKSEIEEPPDIVTLPAIQAYTKYIDAAESGSAKAQFYVSTILERCSNYHPSRLKIENNGEIEDRLYQELMANLRKESDDCKPLYDSLKGADLEELQLAWLKSAADQGHPVALAQSLLNYPGVSHEDALPAIIRSMEHSQGDPFLEHRAMSSTLLYYSRYIEPTVYKPTGSDEVRRGVDRDAWDYLACKHSFNCDLNKLVSAFEPHYYEYEITAFIDRAAEFTDAIRNKRWSDLNLQAE